MLATLTWGRLSMTNGDDQRKFVDLSLSYLPSLKVVGVCAVVGAASWWASNLSTNVEQTRVAVAVVQASLTTNQAASAEEIESLEEDLSELKMELRLLQDYTEGRIGHLPYRPSSTITQGEPRR